MKKLALAAAAILVIAAAGWTAVWFIGRSQVGPILDEEIARLRAQGMGIEYAAREIGGFPLGYRVTHTDVVVNDPRNGATYRLPEVVTEAGATDPSRLVTHLPPKFTVEVPLTPAAREAMPGMPETLVFAIEADAMQVVTTGTPATGPTFTITAKSVLAVSAGKDQPLNVSTELVTVNAGLTLPPTGASTSHLIAERIDYAYTGLMPEGAYTAIGSVEAPRITTTSSTGLLSFADPAANATVVYQTSASESTIRQLDATGAVWTALSFAAASTAGTATFAEGKVELRASSRANRAMVIPAGSTETTGPGATVEAVEMQVTVPLAPSDAPQPFVLRLSLDQATADPALWALFDSGGKLPRDPASLMIDLTGTARMTQAALSASPTGEPPFVVDSLTVNAADLKVLGAQVTTRGALTFPEAAVQPTGTLNVVLSDAMGLPAKLAEAGLVDRASANLAAMMAASLTEPGATPAERVAKIDFTPEGILVNGQPIRN